MRTYKQSPAPSERYHVNNKFCQLLILFHAIYYRASLSHLKLDFTMHGFKSVEQLPELIGTF